MNKEELIHELEALRGKYSFAADGLLHQVLILARQLNEPVTNTSATHLSEQLKTVQEALEFADNAIRGEFSIGKNADGTLQILLRGYKVVPEALSLLPAIIEGVRGMETGVDETTLEAQFARDMADWFFAFKFNSDELARKTIDLLRPYLRTPQPVKVNAGVVEVVNCLQWILDDCYLEKKSDRTKTNINDCRARAKAALAAIQHPEGEI